MGGTSTDVGLIEDGVPQVSGELELEYAMPIHVPMVDVHTIGAGGGSIASVDAAGMLRVGPESAGARPGPICYGRGGTEPTITDANLLLGRLDPDRLLGVDASGDARSCARTFEEQDRQAARPRCRCGGRGHPAHRQRPHGRRHPHGVAVARPRSARLRPVRLRRRGAAARRGAGARARHPERAGPGAARHHQRAGLRRRRPAPRLSCARSTSRWRRSTTPTVARHLCRAEGRGQRDDRRARACRCASCARVLQRRHAVPGPEPHPVRVGVGGPTSASPPAARPSPPPTGAASASSCRRSRRCWSTCTPP